MKRYSPKKVIKTLKKDGWIEKEQEAAITYLQKKEKKK